jgi:predicted transcriptional regulator
MNQSEPITRARKKLHRLLKKFSQRELAKELKITQPAVCQLSTGEVKNPRQSTRRKFERVGISIEDWDQ